ncbi:hypothetical protein GGI07_002836 [Coemansia sp. Benny D115]|nr:hypothetical protein GGI07_002836 [Coemansia sp. Benny D115]
MAQTYPAALSHFAVFCPELGPDEDTAHEQLLFYAAAALPPFYPCSPNDYYARGTHLRRRSSGSSHSAGGASPTTAVRLTGEGNAQGAERVVSLDTKLREIGLATALVSFSSTFTGAREPFHIVRSEKRRTVVYEPEPGILIQLAVVLPRSVRAFGREKDAYSVEFLDHRISDQALKAWVQQEHSAFCLLHGPLSRARAGQQRLVRRQLDAFYGRTLAHWDARWAEELALLAALQPVPRLPIGSISLGGFDELWRDLGSCEPVCGAAVLWRGAEVIWSTGDGTDPARLRALIAWSRAAYAPVFALKPPRRRPQLASQAQSMRVSRQQPRGPSVSSNKPQSSSLLAAGGWLWNWGASTTANTDTAKAATTAERGAQSSNSESRAPAEFSEAESSDEDRSNEDDAYSRSGRDAATASTSRAPSLVAGAGAVGGLTQAFSRAVNLLVEPRPPTPPEADPALAAPESLALPSSAHYTLTAADIDALQQQQQQQQLHGHGPRDADAESLRSVGSLASVRTSATAAPVVGINRVSIARARSNTTQTAGQPGMLNSWQQHAMPSRLMGIPHHTRTPSITSNYSAATADSTQVLRDDTRVSARSWWPQSWMWGSASSSTAAGASAGKAVPAIPESPHMDSDCDSASGLDTSTTFLYTGEYPFPGLSEEPSGDRTPALLLRGTDGKEESGDGGDGSSDGDSVSDGTSSRLNLAMEDNMPPVYAHGANVDHSRGVVLSPRAVPGMLYDTRLLRLLYAFSGKNKGNEISSSNSNGGANIEQPLFMQQPSDPLDGMCKTLVYKYGQMLFIIFGHPHADSNSTSHGAGGADDGMQQRDAQVSVDSQAAPPKFAYRGSASAVARRHRRAMGARRAQQMQGPVATHAGNSPPPESLRFTAEEAQGIETCLLRYAESLHAATLRDAQELQQSRAADISTSSASAARKHTRAPPYIYVEKPSRLTQTNWLPDTPDATLGAAIPLNRSYKGFVREASAGGNSLLVSSSAATTGFGSLSANVRLTLAMVNAELSRTSSDGTVDVCVRMQNKGWVAASTSIMPLSEANNDDAVPQGSECYCVIDQPKATLADALTFLSRVSNQAASASQIY